MRVLLFMPFALLGAALFFESLVPDCSGDGYLYHLSAPLFYLFEGGFVRQDWAVYYHYPLLVEMLYVPALAFGFEQAAILLNFWITLASTALLYRFGVSFGGRLAGWTASFVYLAAPSVVYWSPTSQPETAGTLFLLLSLWALRNWRIERRGAWAVLAGFLAGAMTGCKVLYGLFAIVFLVAVAAAALRDAWRKTHGSDATPLTGLTTNEGRVCSEPRKGRLRGRGRECKSPGRAKFPLCAPFGFAAAAALAYAPWFAKNAFFTGDPFFPVAVGLFPTVETLRGGALALRGLHGFPTWEGSAECVRRALHGYRQLMTESNAGFALGMLWVPIACVWAWRVRGERFFWSVLLAVWLVVVDYGGILQVRWFLPAYAAFALAAGAAAAAIANAGPGIHPLARRAVLLFLGIVLTANWFLGYRDRMGDPPGFHRPWTTLTARGRQEFVSRLPRYAPARLANAHVAPGGRILVFQLPPWPQVRWYKRRFVQNGQDWFGQLANEGLTDAQIAAVWRREGVSHVVSLPSEIDARVTRFLSRNATLVATDSGYALHALDRETIR